MVTKWDEQYAGAGLVLALRPYFARGTRPAGDASTKHLTYGGICSIVQIDGLPGKGVFGMDDVRYGGQAGSPVMGKGGKRGISGSTFKIIAVITMLIDHIAAVILERQIIAEGFRTLDRTSTQAVNDWLAAHGALYWGCVAMRMIGRLGFPIFCFLLVEGFQRTGNVKKYALRLGAFALISEIPFNLAVTGKCFCFDYQNVFFTLLIGLWALCAFRFFGRYDTAADGRDLPRALRMTLVVTGVAAATALVLICVPEAGGHGARALSCLAAVAACFAFYGRKKGGRQLQTICADLTVMGLFMALAEFLRTDYAGTGVLAISAMYLFREKKVYAMLAGCAVLTSMGVNEAASFLAVVPAALYNGERGLKMKYFFYGFYPVHLLLLYLAAVLSGLGGVALF